MLDLNHLSALVASRICHDLISPIGAISNGVELMLLDSTGTTGQEIALILESAAHANARIRFFRIAFGLCGPDQTISQTEAWSILDDGALSSRITLKWDSAATLARRDVKLTFLALMCVETALIHGGAAEVVLGPEGWIVSAAASRLRCDPALWDGLAAASPAEFYGDIAPPHAHFALMALEAARQHRRISVTGGEAAGALTIRF